MNINDAKRFEKYVEETTASAKGGLFLSAVLATEPKMNKTDNPYYGKVMKIQKIHGAAGFEYDTLVNNRLVKEGKESEFEAQKPKGRHHISRLISESDKNPGRYYINIYLFAENYQSFVTYVDITTGKEIDKSALDPWMPARSDADQGGLENKIKMICPMIENIRELTCGDFKA